MSSSRVERLCFVTSALLSLTLAGCAADDADEGREERELVVLAWSVLSGISDLHNQYVVGTPEGAQDRRAPCPFGGEAHITGTTVVPDVGGTEHVELSYALTRCRIAPLSSSGAMRADLTLDGTMDESGSIAEDSTTDETYRSEMLAMVGTVTDGERTTQVDRRCALHANAQPGGVNALICDVNVAW